MKSEKQNASGVAYLRTLMDSYAVTYKLRQISTNEQFKSVFTTEHTSQATDNGSSPFLSMNNIPINQRNVYKLVSNLQPHKATEPDAISAALTFFLPNIS